MIEIDHEYPIETDQYRYEVKWQLGGVRAQCTHRGTGVTAEGHGASQFIARTHARLRVEEIMDLECLPKAIRNLRRSTRDDALTA